MFKKHTALQFFILLFFFIASALNAESRQLISAVCSFNYTNSDDSALSNGIASSFYETLSVLDKHLLKPNELLVLMNEEKEAEIKKKKIEINKLYEQRDNLLFTSDKDKFQELLEEKDESISAALDELKAMESGIKALSASSAASGRVTAELLLKKTEEGLLYSREPGDISKTAEKYDLDFIVYGSVERIDQYRFVEVRLWNGLLKKDTIVWKTAVGNDDITGLIEPGRNLIKTELLGREWAEISIDGPENSMIYLNGKFCGIGKLNRLITDPGEIKVELKKNGYKALARTVTLEKFTSERISFDMEKTDINTVVIQTFPDAADIYLDSVWVGKSPVRLEPENRLSSVVIKKQGYDEKKFFINSSTEEILNINLKALSSGRAEYVSGKRARFYTSMGGFILSLPMTAFFYGMVEQTVSAYNREYEENGSDNYEELQRIEGLNTAQYGLYLASLGMNIFMFLDTIIQAAEYVSSAEYFSN